MTSPRKPTAGFWITVALVAALVAYPLSFGPAYSLILKNWGMLPDWIIAVGSWYCQPLQ